MDTANLYMLTVSRAIIISNISNNHNNSTQTSSTILKILVSRAMGPFPIMASNSREYRFTLRALEATPPHPHSTFKGRQAHPLSPCTVQ